MESGDQTDEAKKANFLCMIIRVALISESMKIQSPNPDSCSTP